MTPIIVASCICGGAAGGLASDGGENPKSLPPLPERLRDLRDLAPEVLAPHARGRQVVTATLITWLYNEHSTPSPTTRGLGGGPIDSGYIKAQIVLELGQTGDRRLIRAARRSARYERIRDWLTVALALTVDWPKPSPREARALLPEMRTLVPHLAALVLSHPEPFLRERAARALGDIGDPAALPALRKALADPEGLRSPGQTDRVIHPVREAARASIRIIESGKGLLQIAGAADRPRAAPESPEKHTASQAGP
jgi:hypothetical protein